MNHVQLMGRLTADPMLRYTANQIPVASFNLAVPRKKQKDREQETDFFTVIAWRTKAEFADKYLRKGQRVAVTGEVQNRSYTDKGGVKRWVTEVIAENIYFADSKTEKTNNHNDYNDVPDSPYPSPEDVYGESGDR